MADQTTIEWVIAVARSRGMDARVWNPVRGCMPISSGCKNCWAAPVAHTRSKQTNPIIRDRHAGLTTPHGKAFNGHIRFLPDDLDIPLRTKRPSVFFAPSEGDLFADGVTDAMRDRILAVVAMTPRHLYLTLTKRPAAMRAYLDGAERRIAGRAVFDYGLNTPADDNVGIRVENGDVLGFVQWPLPNLWLGASVCTQDDADSSVHEVLGTQAVLHFLSVEPLLGPIQLDALYPTGYEGARLNALRGLAHYDGWNEPFSGPRLDWVIVGGESGSGARPMHPDWARSLRDQCAAAAVPFFFKQWGELAPAAVIHELEGRRFREMEEYVEPINGMYWIGKKAAGRLLDGQEHNGVPEVATP